MQAAKYLERGGLSKAEIGRWPGVAHQTVSVWHES